MLTALKIGYRPLILSGIPVEEVFVPSMVLLVWVTSTYTFCMQSGFRANVSLTARRSANLGNSCVSNLGARI